jgi:hypothetical protein
VVQGPDVMIAVSSTPSPPDPTSQAPLTRRATQLSRRSNHPVIYALLCLLWQVLDTEGSPLSGAFTLFASEFFGNGLVAYGMDGKGQVGQSPVSWSCLPA